LGAKDNGFACLEKALDERSYFLVEILNDPKMDKFRSEPRFQSVLARMSLLR
jgi:hypothetical protein